ncbi:MAG: hypothetical protein WD512_20490 [Candidatus Paceibacterota bacterium]
MTSSYTDSWYQINMSEMVIGLTLEELTSVIVDLSNGTIFRLNTFLLSKAPKICNTIRFQTKKRETKCRTKTDYWITNTTRKRLLSNFKTSDFSNNYIDVR